MKTFSQCMTANILLSLGFVGILVAQNERATHTYTQRPDRVYAGRGTLVQNNQSPRNSLADIQVRKLPQTTALSERHAGSFRFQNIETVPESVHLSWAQHYGRGEAPSVDGGLAMTTDGHGNVYVTGASNTTVTSSDYFTIKYSPDGDIYWTARYDGLLHGEDKPSAIAIDTSGNAYVTGFSDGIGTLSDYATVKYDSNGVMQWERRYDGPNDSIDVATAIALDDSGNVYVTGRSMGPSTYWDYTTLKYSPDGGNIWVRRYNNSNGNHEDAAAAIAVDDSGNVYVTGVSFNNGTNRDCYTIKYESSGALQWAVRYNGIASGWDAGTDITVDKKGYVYVTGYSEKANDDGDYITIKYSAGGVQQWAVSYDGPGHSWDEATALTADASGGVHVTGFSYGGPFTGHDFVTIKYDSSGNVQWIDRYNGPDSVGDFARAIEIDPLGNVFVSGGTYKSGGHWHWPGDYATVKYNSAGSRQWVMLYDCANKGEDGYAMALDASGDVYITGWSEDSLYNCDYATVKYKSSGTEQWIKRYDGPGGSYDQAVGLAVDGLGNVYVTGGSYSKTTGNDFLTIKYSPAGTVEWIEMYDGPGSSQDEPKAIAIDPHGNVFVTGSSFNTAGNLDYVTLKYSPSGVREWVARYDGEAHADDGASAIVSDTGGNVYVTGQSVQSGTNGDFTTIKYTPSGEVGWITHYMTDEFDGAIAIAVDQLGNVYVTGRSGADTLADYVTVKYNAAGEERWTVRYDHADNWDEPVAIDVDDWGNVYVTGNSLDPLTREDIATVKYDTDGNFRWVRRYTNPIIGQDQATDLVVDAHGNAYITGSLLDDGGDYDYLTVKYDSAGEQRWAERYNGRNDWHDKPGAIAIDAAGDVYVTGASYLVPERTDIVTIKYRSNGGSVWIVAYDGPMNARDGACALYADESGNVSIAGNSSVGGGYVFTTLKYTQSTTMQYEVTRGWNMVSVPLLVSDYRKTALFPTAISRAFTYEGSYVPKDTLANGIGYWLKFSGDQAVEISGFPIAADTIDVFEGWNMIGSISQTLPVSAISSIPSDLGTSQFFTYDGRYVKRDTILPGSA